MWEFYFLESRSSIVTPGLFRKSDHFFLNILSYEIQQNILKIWLVFLCNEHEDLHIWNPMFFLFHTMTVSGSIRFSSIHSQKATVSHSIDLALVNIITGLHQLLLCPWLLFKLSAGFKTVGRTVLLYFLPLQILSSQLLNSRILWVSCSLSGSACSASFARPCSSTRT